MATSLGTPSDNVTAEHPDFTATKRRYKLIRDIINNNAKHYIRKPCNTDDNNYNSYRSNDPSTDQVHLGANYLLGLSRQDEHRNEVYQDQAILTNFTSLTLDGLSGLIFSKPPQVQLPPQLQYLTKDCTGSGIDLYQFSQTGIKEIIQTGRYFCLLNYNQQTSQVNILPYIAEAVINWKLRLVDGKMQPWLITLVEQVIANPNDKFCQDFELQYRVLLLDENDDYYQEIYNDAGELVNYEVPLDYNGQQFKYIPHKIIGALNNDFAVDKPPLYDMAIINLGHYRNSADHEESIFLCGQPYVVVSVGDQSVEEFLQANPQGVYFGSRTAVLLPLNGNAHIMQASPNTLVRQAMLDKLDEAARIGARFIDPAGGRETAVAAKIRYGSQTASLYILTYNFTSGINALVQMICNMMGIPTAKFTYKLNDEFDQQIPDPVLFGAMLTGITSGVIAVADARAYGRLTGFIDEDRTDAMIDADIAKQKLLVAPAPVNTDPNGDNLNINPKDTQNVGTTSGKNLGNRT